MTIVDDIREAATHVGSKTKLRPTIGVVLGSGLGGYADALLDTADCRVVGIDRDPAAIARGQAMIDYLGGRRSARASALPERSRRDELDTAPRRTDGTTCDRSPSR